MIIREIRFNTKEVIATFDWFNDYTDTLSYAKGACPCIIPELRAGYKKWQAEFMKDFKKDSTIKS